MSIVIGAKWGKLLPVGEESKSVKLELKGRATRRPFIDGSLVRVPLRGSVCNLEHKHDRC